MKKNSKKKKLMAAAAGLALIAAISGTFAWITSQDQRVNRAASSAVKDNSTTIVEEWEPKPLVPGTEAKKKVSITNTGTAGVFVRISYEEVLKHLADKGAVKYAPSTGTGAVEGAKYTYVANDPGLNKHMPVATDGAHYLSAAGGFTEVPTAQVTGLETNTKLIVKGGRLIDPVTGVASYSYDAKVIHEYDEGKYQIMTANVAVPNRNSEVSNDAKDWTFTVSELKYGYYENGYKHTVVNWAKSTLEDEAGHLTGNALLGTNGSRYDVNYDYRVETLGLTAIPEFTPATDGDQIPTAAGEKNTQADVNGLGTHSIHIKYSNAVVDTAGLANASNHWIYNKEDGWFYYTQPLAGGQTTADLLESLVYGADLGTEYTNASYDLTVKLEAIQATKEALTDSTGWGMTLNASEKPVTQAIYDKLAQ